MLADILEKMAAENGWEFEDRGALVLRSGSFGVVVDGAWVRTSDGDEHEFQRADECVFVVKRFMSQTKSMGDIILDCEDLGAVNFTPIVYSQGSFRFLCDLDGDRVVVEIRYGLRPDFRRDDRVISATRFFTGESVSLIFRSRTTD